MTTDFTSIVYVYNAIPLDNRQRKQWKQNPSKVAEIIFHFNQSKFSFGEYLHHLEEIYHIKIQEPAFRHFAKGNDSAGKPWVELKNELDILQKLKELEKEDELKQEQINLIREKERREFEELEKEELKKLQELELEQTKIIEKEKNKNELERKKQEELQRILWEEKRKSEALQRLAEEEKKRKQLEIEKIEKESEENYRKLDTWYSKKYHDTTSAEFAINEDTDPLSLISDERSVVMLCSEKEFKSLVPDSVKLKQRDIFVILKSDNIKSAINNNKKLLKFLQFNIKEEVKLFCSNATLTFVMIRIPDKAIFYGITSGTGIKTADFDTDYFSKMIRREKMWKFSDLNRSYPVK